MASESQQQPGLEHVKDEGALPEAVRQQQEQYQPELKPYHGNYKPFPGHQGERRICGMRRATFILSVALTIVLALGVVGTGVAGSLAVKRQHEVDRLRREMSLTPTSTTSSSQSSSPSAAGASQSPNPSSLPANATSPPPVGPSSAIKTDCQSLKSPWVSDQPALGNSVFQIYCGTDYPNNDLLGIYSDSLEGCMMACASYNNRASSTHPDSKCGVITFDQDPQDEGNCWLKEVNNDPASKSPNAMSARVISQSS